MAIVNVPDVVETMDVTDSPTSKKKVAVLVTAISGGGAERVVSTLLHGLSDEFDFYLVLLHNSILYELPEGLKIHCLNNSPQAEKGFLKILTLPRYAYKYSRFCREQNIKTSISFLTRSHYVNCMSKSFGNSAKVIISERTFVTGYFKSLSRFSSRVQRFLLKMLYPKADLIIPNSTLGYLDLKETFKLKTKFEVIKNPVDIAGINKQSQEPVNYKFHGFTFIHVAAMRKEKNYELLLNAFSMIDDKECKLLLLGTGDMEKTIQRIIKDKRLEQRVILPGRDNNPYKYLSRAGCFVLSSDFEGFPNVVLEALACRLPVISTDCKSGPREILAPGTDITRSTEKVETAEFGILVPVADPKLLSEAMNLIMHDKALADHYKHKALERAADFDVPAFIEQFRKVL